MRAFKKGKLIQGASNKCCYQNSEGFFKSPLDGTLTNGIIMCRSYFFGLFILRLRRIKRSQVMFMTKFGHTAPSFGYD